MNSCIFFVLTLALVWREGNTFTVSYSPYPGYQMAGIFLCSVPTKDKEQSRLCWHMRPDRHYEMLLRQKGENKPSSRKSETFPEPSDPELARFNIHLYLDHMWHLNIGFSR